jgi:dipeptidyl aminopeptidase/acylaminoacyl peptidase
MSADQAANWEHIHAAWSPYWMDRTAREYGSPASDPAFYAAISPANYLDRVRAPVQIHHGTADTEVPPEWSRDLYAELRRAGMDATLYLYPGAGHTFYGPARDRFLERAFRFFETHVKGE